MPANLSNQAISKIEACLAAYSSVVAPMGGTPRLRWIRIHICYTFATEKGEIYEGGKLKDPELSWHS